MISLLKSYFNRSLAYALLLDLLAVASLGTIWVQVRNAMTEQMRTTIRVEMSSLGAEYQRGGLGALTTAVAARTHVAPAALYLLSTAGGEALAGNVGAIEPKLLGERGWAEMRYKHVDSNESDHHALIDIVPFAGGFRLLIGFDLSQRDRVLRILEFFGAVAILASLVLVLRGRARVSADHSNSGRF